MALGPTTHLTPQEFALLRQYVEAESGISLGDDKQYLLESRLKGLMADMHCSGYGELYRQIKEDKQGHVRQKVIDAITTNETLWFRDKAPFVILEEFFLPAMVERIRSGKPRVRIWSAACSTGQEPYSIAIVIHNFLQRLGDGNITPQRFEIIATDISKEALGVAQMGAYDQFSMDRGMDTSNIHRYFKQNQRFWIIDPALKKIIDFRQFNLLGDFTGLGTFDMVLCRNVAIYFSHETKIRLFDKIRRVLNPRGLFVLGSTESMTFYTQAFESKAFKNNIYYEVVGS